MFVRGNMWIDPMWGSGYHCQGDRLARTRAILTTQRKVGHSRSRAVTHCPSPLDYSFDGHRGPRLAVPRADTFIVECLDDLVEAHAWSAARFPVQLEDPLERFGFPWLAAEWLASFDPAPLPPALPVPGGSQLRDNQALLELCDRSQLEVRKQKGSR